MYKHKKSTGRAEDVEEGGGKGNRMMESFRGSIIKQKLETFRFPFSIFFFFFYNQNIIPRIP